MARRVGKHEKVETKKRKARKERTKKFKFPFFRIISLIIAIICVVYIWQWAKENKHSEDVMKIVNEAVVEKDTDGEKDGKTNIDFKKLKKINPDIIGWIKVNNTKINYPVVQSEDNSYYLEHSFDREYNAAGWPFMDYRVNLDGKDKNMTIYGHNRKDRSMFGSLEDILDSEWYENEENLKIEYITEEGTEMYQVFSIYQIEKETYYTNNYFATNEEFNSFINELKNRSKVDFGVEVNCNDKILTLSTCADNNQYRTVLHAKKINKQ